jgi:hypothetical protein
MRERIATHLPQLILLANAGAFAVLLAELLITDHTDGSQLIAPVAAAIGIALCGIAAVLPPRLRLAPAAFLVVLSISGVVGFYQHMDEWDGGLSGLFQSSDDDDDDDDDRNSGRGSGDEEDEDDDDDDAETPPLAPLGISGTALLSALAAFAVPRRED